MTCESAALSPDIDPPASTHDFHCAVTSLVGHGMKLGIFIHGGEFNRAKIHILLFEGAQRKLGLGKTRVNARFKLCAQANAT